MGQYALTESERQFFQAVKNIIYSNPFAMTQNQIAKQFQLKQSSHHSQRNQHHFGLIAQPLEHHLQQLQQRGITQLKHLHKDDRQLVRHAYLFDLYHQTVDNWDQHIQQQLQQPEQTIPLTFSQTLLNQFQVKGFSPSEALRYFGLFFQVRRAYFFIDQALIGQCPAIVHLRRELWNSLFTENALRYEQHLWDRMEDFSTLLLGETGTGKGAAAAAIGRSAFIPFDADKNCFKENFTQNFVATNLSQFAVNLIESELFGHQKGAFTGAISQHKGLLERCSRHGALFLDEIGEVTPSVQIKLLKVLQERQFTPVGSHKEHRFSGRIIAATNRKLEELMNDPQFRNDFYYRLSSHVITMPSLRKRIQESSHELQLMVEFLLQRTLGSSASQLYQEVLETIQLQIPSEYPWPGNVRELEQVIRRVLLQQNTGCIAMPSPPPAADLEQQLLTQQLSAQQLLSRYCQAIYQQQGTYEAVARITGLDRRTVKKYLN